MAVSLCCVFIKKTVEGIHFHVRNILGCFPKHIQTLLGGEHVMFCRVQKSGDDQFIDHLRASFYNIKMTIGYRIKTSRAYS